MILNGIKLDFDLTKLSHRRKWNAAIKVFDRAKDGGNVLDACEKLLRDCLKDEDVDKILADDKVSTLTLAAVDFAAMCSKVVLSNG